MPSTSINLSSQAVASRSQPAGQMLVFTGPSGVGKGTLLRHLLTRYPEIQLSISATTRQPRPGEAHGKDYYFVSRSDFEAMVEQRDLLEWAEFAGNFYGTPRKPLEAMVAKGHTIILEIELDGARQVRQSLPGARQIFVLPPSLEELEARIRGRGQDSDEAIAKRLQRAQVEIAAAAEFDIQIVNDTLEQALGELERAVFTPQPTEVPPPSPPGTQPLT